MTKMDFKRL